MRNTIEQDKDLQELKELAKKQNAVNADADKTKVLFQMRIPTNDRNTMKAFFAQQGIATSDGMLKAFYFCKQMFEAGEIGLNSATGFFKR